MTLTRRAWLAGTAATPLIWNTAFADTPRDVVVMAKQIDDIISLDPHESFEFSGNEVGGNCYEKLVNPSDAKPSDIRGELAERWEASEDGLTYTFHLRDGRKFASGSPVTAEDVAFSIERVVKMDKPCAFIINQFGFTKDNVTDRVRAIDPRTLQLRISERQAPTFLLYCLSANVGGVVDKKLLMLHAQNDDYGNTWLKTNSAGSGPWVVRNWRASESVLLDAVAGHANAGKMKRMIIRHIADPSAQLLLLQKGDVDIARDLSADQLKALANNPEFGRLARSKASVLYVGMNLKYAPLAKPQVRQAIKWAIDYQAIQKNITGDTFEVHQSFLPKGFPAALDDTPFHKDTAKARALLAEAGFAGGFDVELDHASSAPTADIAQAIQGDLGQAGIRVKLLAGERRQVITKTRARQHQLTLQRWGSDYFDPHSNAETFCMNPDNSDGARNRTGAWAAGWKDDDLTQRAVAAVHEVDAETRTASYIQMQKDHMERSPMAILLQEVQTAVMRKNVSGLVLGALSDRTTYAQIEKG